MDLRFMDNGATLIINVATYNKIFEQEYKARFYSLLSTTSFLAEDEELYKDFNNLESDTHLKIFFFRNGNIYCFDGKAKNILIKNKAYLTQIDQISAIEVSTRRFSPRHEISTLTNLYLPSAHNSNDFSVTKDNKNILLSAHTFDISTEGLCILTNRKLDPKENKLFLLEFVLNKNDRFVFLSTLVRLGNSPQSVQFKYDYGFLFDFTNRPEEKSRLSTSIFKHKFGGI